MARAPIEGFLLTRVDVPVVLRVGSADYELGSVSVPVYATQGDRQPGQHAIAVELNARLDGTELRSGVAQMLRDAAAKLEEAVSHGG
ncbi:hypothetical protein ACFQYP_50625 [Nonomuraea antimicrobica]